MINEVLSKVIPGQDVLVSDASSLLDMPEMSWGEVSLFWFILVDFVPIISNYAPTRAKWRTEGKEDPKGSFVQGCYVRSRFHQLKKDGRLSQL